MTERMNENILLNVENLVTHFFTEEGVVRAVDGVSFSINKNEIMGLVGETGCGKSVTALSILQLIRYPGKIVKGNIFFEGINLARLTTDQIRLFRGNEITMIFQDPTNSLNPVMTVGYQISEVFELHQYNEIIEDLIKRNDIILIRKQQIKNLKIKLKSKLNNDEKISIEHQIKELNSLRLNKFYFKEILREKSKKILDTVGIADSEEILDRFPHELSGGMKQRVMISMGLACNSKLLICDEPTTALDVTIQAQILQLIRDLKNKIKNSVLFITHDLGVIYELCDKVAVMYAGNIVEYGDVHEMFKNPTHPYTQGLLGSIPRIKEEDQDLKLSVIPGLVPNLLFDLPGCRFHPRCSHAMKICQIKRPKLIQKSGISVACYLYDEKDKNITPDLFVPLDDKQKKRYDL